MLQNKIWMGFSKTIYIFSLNLHLKLKQEPKKDPSKIFFFPLTVPISTRATLWKPSKTSMKRFSRKMPEEDPRLKRLSYYSWLSKTTGTIHWLTRQHTYIKTQSKTPLIYHFLLVVVFEFMLIWYFQQFKKLTSFNQLWTARQKRQNIFCVFGAPLWIYDVILKKFLRQ